MADFEWNGQSSTVWNLTAQRAPGLLSTPTLNYGGAALPDRPGSLTGLRTVGTKPFQVECMLSADTLAEARGYLDAINLQATRVQPSTVIFGWSTTRRLSAECLGVQVTPLAQAFGVFTYDVRVLFDAPDPPFFEATSATTISGVGTTGVPLPAGNAPILPLIRLQSTGGAFSDIKVTLRNSTGTEVASITLANVTASSSEYVVIDMDNKTIYENETGVGSSGSPIYATLSTGDFFDVRSEYADIASSSFATIETTTGTLEIEYKQAWW